MKILDLITTDDNVTLEPSYVLGVIAFSVGVGLEIYSVVKQHPFDFQSYGIGVGTFLAGMGAGKWAGNKS